MAARFVYSTYLGGTAADRPNVLALHGAGCGRAADDDAQGNQPHLCDIYVAGGTASRNFPTTANAFQRTYGGGPRDGFVVKFSSGSEDTDEAADQ